MSEPTAESQIQFLIQIQRLLAEGVFTATYKYALLLALADLAIEVGNDSGGELLLSTTQIAEKFIDQYWRQAAPYLTTSQSAEHILLQNTKHQAAVIRLLTEIRGQTNLTLGELKQSKRWNPLVRAVEKIVREMPLWKLQRAGGEVLDFLYEQRGEGQAIVLWPGVAFCFRRFHVLLTELVRGAWLGYIRRLNQEALGTTIDLSAFLFGSERQNLSEIHRFLTDLQQGKCFYCHSAVKRESGEVDHFIPWSLYPVDLGHNFVLAHASCNRDKSDMIASSIHLASWTERNQSCGSEIGSECNRIGMNHDLSASMEITRWAYSQAYGAGSFSWVQGKHYEQLPIHWASILDSNDFRPHLP